MTPPTAEPSPEAASTQPMASVWPIARMAPTVVSSRPPRQNPAAATATRIARTWGLTQETLVGAGSAVVASAAGSSSGEAVGGSRAMRPRAPRAATTEHPTMVGRVPRDDAAMIATVGPIM